MADRIFPSAAHETLGAEMVWNGIDYSDLAERIATAKSESKKMPKELLEHFEEMSGKKEGECTCGECDACMSKKASKKEAGTLPPALKKWQEEHGKGKKKSTDDEDEKDEKDDEEVESTEKDSKMMKKGKDGKDVKASARLRKVHFASADQISSNAIEAALDSGDEALANAILAARQENRVRLGQQAYAAAAAQMERTAAINKRHAYRMNLVNSITEVENKIAEASSKPKAKTASKNTDTQKGQFKEVTAMTASEKEAFIKVAEAEGFPREYVNEILGLNEAPVSAEVEKIMSVMASNLDSNVKIAAVKSMVKVAELSEADRQRAIRFWKDDLGYQDADWVDDLFSNKYN